MAQSNLAPIDIEINTQKVVLRQLQIKVKTFTTIYLKITPKDRAKMLSEIQKTFESLARFFDKFKGLNVQNTGTKFAAENLKASYFSLLAVWRKFENSLNSTQAG